MTRTKSTYLALLTVLLAPMAAQADLTDFGPSGEYFFDTDTGLYWQDIANFLGQTQAEVEAFVAASVIWNLASQAEMEALLGASSQGGVSLTEIMGPRQSAITGGDRWVGFLDVTTVDPLLPGDPNGWLVQTNAAGLSTITATGFQNFVELQTHGAWVNSSVNPTIDADTTFSIVVIPDTQMYVEQHPEVFEAQVDWIVANEAVENIIYVAHLGDLKDDLSCDTKTVNVGTGGGRSEWEIVDDTLGDLDAAGIPYGLVPGNHDFDQVSGTCPNFTTQRPLGTYNSLVGPLRFAGLPHYGDPGVPTPGNRVVNSNEDNFTLFESSGVKLIAINLAYRQGANAVNNDPEVVWADALLKAYPDRLGIITSHYFMDENPGNSLGPYGQEIYDGLSNNPNMFMMLSAHEFGEAWLVETTGRGGMEPVQILLSDYQRDVFPAVDGDINTPPNDPNPAGIDFTDIDQTSFGDSGFMRIMRFDTVTGMVNIETFIPPVIPVKNRPGTLISTYFPGNGNGMGEGTASNLSFSYLGYVP